MKAITIIPGKGDAHLTDIPEPVIQAPDEVKLMVIEIGVCGTDREEVSGGRADAPAGEQELIIGHEMFGQVVETGSAVKKVKKGDYALFMVRRPCNHCDPCHQERSDMCETGGYTERGIKGSHGFQAEYVVDKEEFLIPVPAEISGLGVLTEPMSVVVKAIDEAFLLQSSRMPCPDRDNWLRGKKALVAGIGPIGLLAAFLLELHGAKVFGLDIVDESSLKAQILKEIGGSYINGLHVSADIIDDHYGKMDFILEATGIAKLEFQLLDALGNNGIYVLTGIPAGNRPLPQFSSTLMQQMVLKNQVMFGSVNASLRHYYDAVDDLVKIINKWGNSISKLITERVPYADFKEAILAEHKDEIKILIEWHKVSEENPVEAEAAAAQ